uniref:UBC core domain-containing protein n=1 Tax=Hanusia phi TaxID=3032 RepID=A0A7S0EQQ4_9CRYP
MSSCSTAYQFWLLPLLLLLACLPPCIPGMTPPVVMSPHPRLRSTQILTRQLRDIQESPSEFFSAGLVNDSDLFEWDVCIAGPPDTIYEGGIFSARLSFPDNYPDKPPRMRFLTPVWHPNVYLTGDVCISILHDPGEDETNPEELASMRWSPVHSVETIVLSVISMLSDPTDDSPANIEAAIQLRSDYNLYKQRVLQCVAESLG